MISCITVNYKDWPLTRQLIDSLKESVDDLEWIVVDNATVEKDRKEFERDYPWVKVLAFRENLGFAAANNVAIRQAKHPFIFLLNNDVKLSSSAIFPLLRYLEEQPGTAAVCPKVYYSHAENIIEFAGFTSLHPYLARNQMIGQGEEDRGQFAEMKVLPYLYGAAVMFRKKIIEDAGDIPEAYFLYYEEIEWSVNIRKADYLLAFEPKAHVYHASSATIGKASPTRIYYYYRNRWLFMRRNAQAFQKFVFGLYYVLLVLPIGFLKFMLKGRFDLLAALFRAFLWHWGNRTTAKGPYPRNED